MQPVGVGSGPVAEIMIHNPDTFARLVRDERLVGPAQQILSDDELYVQQVKVNAKEAFTGEQWQWHYDFATHHHEDGVPEPLALNLHIFLDALEAKYNIRPIIYTNPSLYKQLPYDPDDFTTVAGFMLNQLGHLPGIGEQILYRGFCFEVATADERRISGVRVSRIAGLAEAAAEKPALAAASRTSDATLYPVVD